MTAHPVDDHDPDDPVETLAVLPEGYRAQFLAKHTVAVESARPGRFREDFARRAAAAWAMEET